MSRNHAKLAAALTSLALAACSPPADDPPPETPLGERVGITVTGWGTVKGSSPEYNAGLYRRAFLGERATAPDQPCTEWYLGEFPYRSSLGQIPFAVVFKVDGFERIWDGYGVYKFRQDDQSYVSVLDDNIVLSRDEVGDAKVIPAREMPFGGRAFFFHPDPRDGTDHLAGYYKIMKPNGLHDAFEQATLSAMRRDALMGYTDLPPTKHQFQEDLENSLVDYFDKQFGDRVEVRFGYYAGIPGVTTLIEDAAADFAREGYTRLLVARDTTDHNIYANVTWDLNHTLKGLCEAGFETGDGGIAVQQVRQVGRTPEYNQMLVKNLARHLDIIEPGSEISIVYATHGYPWPGSRPVSGPLSKPAPEVTYVFHENSYLNYLSFKAYALAAFDETQGGRYRLNFSKSGSAGGTEARIKNLFGYAHIYEPLIGHPKDPLKFQTVRNVLETAIREDGRREIIIVLSHWYKDSNNTAVEIRELNDMPLNTIEEMNSGIYSITWCERYTAPGEFDQYRPQSGQTCTDGYARVQVTEAFNDVAEDFIIGYANRIRGGVERYGLFPDLDIEILAQGPVTASGGGTVAVEHGELAGARLRVRPDPNPGIPESYTWEAAYRPATGRFSNTSDDAIRPINDYTQISDFLDGAKDDFDAYIGIQGRIDGSIPLPTHPRAVSRTVYFGPYRTLFNAPAEITIPFEPNQLSNPADLRAYIYNEVSKDFDPVFPVTGGSPIRVDEENGLASFDVQVLGNFVLALEE